MSTLLHDTAQRDLALARANKVRHLRMLMKRDLDIQGAVQMLRRPPWWLETMKVASLLDAIPYYGQARVRRLLLVCRASDNKTVGGLSDRQRHDLICELLDKERSAA